MNNVLFQHKTYLVLELSKSLQWGIRKRRLIASVLILLCLHLNEPFRYFREFTFNINPIKKKNNPTNKIFMVPGIQFCLSNITKKAKRSIFISI